MQIFIRKGFTKSYSKLSPRDQNLVNEALVVFEENPFQEELKNHALKGSMKGQRAFSAGFDLRIIYREEGDHAVVYLIKTGSHNQVY
jgi:addiction module RelE/StbE family toxin